MIKSYSRLSLGWMLVLLGCAHITINVYFTDKQIQDAAERLEEKVRGEVLELEEDEAIESFQSKATGSWLDFFMMSAYAEEPKLKTDSPQINALIKERKKRFKQIDRLLTKGVIGEGKNGYLKEKDIKQLVLKEIPQVRKMLKSENQDRKKMYQLIVGNLKTLLWDFNDFLEHF